jgi:hypothetical protein
VSFVQNVLGGQASQLRVGASRPPADCSGRTTRPRSLPFVPESLRGQTTNRARAGDSAETIRRRPPDPRCEAAALRPSRTFRTSPPPARLAHCVPAPRTDRLRRRLQLRSEARPVPASGARRRTHAHAAPRHGDRDRVRAQPDEPREPRVRAAVDQRRAFPAGARLAGAPAHSSAQHSSSPPTATKRSSASSRPYANSSRSTDRRPPTARRSTATAGATCTWS